MSTRLGFKPCVAGCGTLVHYKSKACKSCGAVQTVAAPAVQDTPKLPPEAPVAQEPVKSPVAASVVQMPGSAMLGPHIALNDFRTQLGDVNVSIKQGKVVVDQVLIRKLLENGAPIVPASDANSLACCPSCGKVFAPKPVKVGAKGAA